MKLDWVLSHWRVLRTAGIHLLATIRLTLGAVLSERWAVEDGGPEEAMVIEVGMDGGSRSGENGKMERNGYTRGLSKGSVERGLADGLDMR